MTHPTLTLFAIPKPMSGDADRLQFNAFDSWKRLGARLNICLCGNEAGVAQAASRFGFQHLPQLATNSQGTPLLDDCFEKVRETNQSAYLAYVNADIILGSDFIRTFDHLQNLTNNRFLGIGQRWESQLSESTESWYDDQLNDWVAEQRIKSPRASIVCKDYFIFPRHLFTELPAFAVGRGNWDNWMVYHAHKTGIPVIDLTDSVTAVHQPHGHSHCGGRMQAYVAGEEAKENQRLANGKHLWLGAHASHRLTSAGKIERQNWRVVSRAIGDVPRFVQLLTTFRDIPNKSGR